MRAEEHETTPKRSGVFPIAVGCAFWIVVIAVIAWITPTGQAFLRTWWWALALALAGFLVMIGVYPRSRRWLDESTPTRRVAIVVFGLIPILLFLVTAVVALPAKYQVTALRSVFLLLVGLFPAIMYYLFIAMRKYSLLEEFVSNLDRFRLLTPRRYLFEAERADIDELELRRQRRVLTYLRKFEGAYGPVPKGMVKVVLSPPVLREISSEQRWARLASVGSTSIFTPETVVPVVAATLLIGLGWLIVLPPWRTDLPPAELSQQWIAALDPEQTPVRFAFLGAYFFSVQMLFRRFVRRDLRASAYVGVSLRIVLAVIATWVAVLALSDQATPDQLALLGFVIGVFPRTVWQVVQAALKRVFMAGVLVPTLKTQLPVSDLDGLTVWHEARLEEEDIENIPNMATADPVELMLNTRFSGDRIVDWIDQAILYTDLGVDEGLEARQRLRAHGIRTATSLIEVYQLSGLRGDSEAFEAILPGKGKQRSPIRSLVATASVNPNLELIWIWRGLASTMRSAVG